MLKFVLPSEETSGDVTSFYEEFEKNGETCIGFRNSKNYSIWLQDMRNRHDNKNLPNGFVRENFYICYENDELVGVFSLKFELTEYLLKYGGHVGYAVRPSRRNAGIATKILRHGLELAEQFGFDRILCVCDNDNYASEKVILKNGGVFDNELYDSEEQTTVKRYWIELHNKSLDK